MATVKMYTFYKDLSPRDPVDQLRKIQFERDSALFEAFKKEDLPMFPMSYLEFCTIMPKLDKISKEMGEHLCMAFITSNCIILNNGALSSYETLKDAQVNIMNVSALNLRNVINKYEII